MTHQCVRVLAGRCWAYESHDLGCVPWLLRLNGCTRRLRTCSSTQKQRRRNRLWLGTSALSSTSCSKTASQRLRVWRSALLSKNEHRCFPPEGSPITCKNLRKYFSKCVNGRTLGRHETSGDAGCAAEVYHHCATLNQYRYQEGSRYDAV
jgi:hypothetical protein